MWRNTDAELRRLHIRKATAKRGVYNAQKCIERAQERLAYWERQVASQERQIDAYHADKGTDPRKRQGGYSSDKRREEWERAY